MGIKFTGVTRRAPVHGYRVSTANYKGKFTLDEAAKRVVEFQKEAQKRNEDGEISVNLLLPNKDETKAGRWISATKFTNINENLDLTKFADVGEDYFGHLQLILPEHFFGMQIHVSSFGKN